MMNREQDDRHRATRTLEILLSHVHLQVPRSVVVSAYVFSIGSLGLLPHLLFSLHVHEISYLQYAYDEPFYATLALTRAIVPGRILSGAFFRGLYFVCGHNLELALILSDFIFPCACALAAVYAAGCLSKRVSGQLVTATLLLFGQELLSLGSSTVWPGAPFNILSLRQALGSWGAVLIANSSTSYFAVFRTLEPQATWPFVFAFLGFSYRLFTRRQTTPGAREKLAFVVLCALASLGYVFCAFAILLFILSLLLRSVISGPKALGPTFLLSLAVGGFLFVAPVVQISRSGQGLYSAHDPFHSRLPSLGVSVLVGLLLLCLSWVLSRKLGWKDPKLHFLIISASLPLILMEQQVISGVMVTTSQWERYINYQLLMFGAAIGVSLYGLGAKRRLMRAQPVASLLVLVFLSYLIVHGQNQTYRMWLHTNEVSVAQKRAVEDSLKQSPSVRRIVIEDPTGAALLSVRLPPAFEVLADYGRLFSEPIANMPADGSPPAGREPHLLRLLEYLARTNKTPEWLSSKLQEEAETREGFYLGFLFSFKDFWGPFSDYRRVPVDAIRAQIPTLVDRYRQYLQSLWKASDRPTIYLASDRTADKVDAGYWQYSLIGKGQSNSATPLVVWAYLQTPRQPAATAGPPTPPSTATAPPPHALGQ